MNTGKAKFRPSITEGKMTRIFHAAACILLLWPRTTPAQNYCPPSSCQVGSGCGIGVGVGVGIGVNRWSSVPSVPSLPLAPVERTSCVVPVLIGTDPSPVSGVYVGVIRGRGVVLTCLHAARHGVRAVAGVRPIDIYRDMHGYDMVAVLIPPQDIPTAPIGVAPGSGATVTILGHPSGRFGRHRGRVIGLCRPEGSQPWGDLRIDTPCQDGDSGGAVLDDSGNLVGMIWGTDANGTAGSVAVSIEAIADFLRRLEITLGGGEPVTPAEPVAPLPPPIPATNCDDLRVLIQQNAEAIAALAAVARVPGPPGPQGPSGKTPDIDYEQLAAEVIKRLPPVRLQTIKADGTMLQESSAPLGQPIKLRLVPITPSGAK